MWRSNPFAVVEWTVESITNVTMRLRINTHQTNMQENYQHIAVLNLVKLPNDNPDARAATTTTTTTTTN